MGPRGDRPTHRRRLLAATLTLLLALSVGIPAALARAGHGKPHEPTPAAAPGSPASIPKPAADAPAGAQQPSASQRVAARPVNHDRRSERIGSGKPGESVTGAARGAPHGASRHGKGAGDEAKALAPTIASVNEKDTGGQAAGAAAPGTALSVEQRRAQERAGRVSPSRVTPGNAKHVESLRANAPKGSGTSGSSSPAGPPVAALAARTTAASIPSSPATAPAPAPAAQPQPIAAAPSAATHARAKHRPARRPRARTQVGGATAASRPATLAAPAATKHRHASAGRGHGAARGTASPSIVAPLATTITKIVGVVPTPVRVLIGVLVALALALAVRSRFAARRARRLERQRGQLLEDVGLLQAALLPVPPARLGPVGTSAAYRPAAGPAAGGDFYDVFALEDGQLAVIVGDVSGHGRKALPHTALVRFTLRAYLEAGLSPRGAVQTAGAVLDRQLGGSFATVIAATYNPRTRTLVYASAGHPPPLILSEDHHVLETITAGSAPPIGVGRATGTRQSIVSIPGRALLCFYTDGVTEARLGSELFGPIRLADVLSKLGPGASAADVLDRVSEQVDRRPDDMATCLLSLEGEAQPPQALREEIELDRETAGSERTERFLLACGLPRGEARAIVQAARAEVEETGSLVVELHRDGSHARATFQHDNLAYLHTRHAARQAELTVSS
jgi:hypothetical protein